MPNQEPKPTVLFLSNEFRWPTSTGTQLRISKLLDFYAARFSVTLIARDRGGGASEEMHGYLSDQGIRVRFVQRCTVKRARLTRFVRWLVGPKTVEEFDAESFSEAVREAVEENGPYDIIHVDRWYLTDAVAEDLSRRQFARTYVVDVDASEYERRRLLAQRFRGSPWAAAKVRVEPLRVMLWERRHLRKYDAVLMSSPTECSGLARRSGLHNLVLVRNGYDAPRIGESSEGTLPTLVFVGTLGYAPNLDAWQYMAQEILPLVRGEIPSVELWHVGSADEGAVRRWTSVAGVRLLGFVPDLAKIYEQATVVVVPVREGAGTRIKVLEAAAFGKPIVATRFAIMDLDLGDRVSVALAEDATSFADSCIRLLRDRALRDSLGREARRYIERNCQWAAVTKDLGDSLARLGLVGQTDGVPGGTF